MNVHVTGVLVPPMSTVGYGQGWAEGACGKRFAVTFVGDARPMIALGIAARDGKDPIANVPEYAVLSAEELEEVDQ